MDSQEFSELTEVLLVGVWCISNKNGTTLISSGLISLFKNRSTCNIKSLLIFLNFYLNFILKHEVGK